MNWVNNSKFVSAYAVVIAHVAGVFVAGIERSNASHGGVDWWAGNIFDAFPRWCVPVFLMLSGYFLLNKEESMSDFFKRRLNKLFTPLIFWSLFFSVYTFLKILAITGEPNLALAKVAIGFLTGKPYFHLWYLLMLPFLYFVTPYLKIILREASKKESLAFMIFLFALSAINTICTNIPLYLDLKPTFPIFINTFLMFLCFFYLGGYIKKYDTVIKQSYAIVGLILASVISIFGTYFFSYHYFYSLTSLNIIIASVSAFFIMKRYLNFDFFNSSQKLASLSFGVYLIHPVFIDVINYAAKDKIMETMNAFIYIPVMSVAIFLASLLVTLVMSKIKLLKECV